MSNMIYDEKYGENVHRWGACPCYILLEGGAHFLSLFFFIFSHCFPILFSLFSFAPCRRRFLFFSCLSIGIIAIGFPSSLSLLPCVLLLRVGIHCLYSTRILSPVFGDFLILQFSTTIN